MESWENGQEACYGYLAHQSLLGWSWEQGCSWKPQDRGGLGEKEHVGLQYAVSKDGRAYFVITLTQCKTHHSVGISWHRSAKGKLLMTMREKHYLKPPICLKYFIIFRQSGREGEREGGEREGEKESGCLLSTPWGPGPQPRHVPWLGIEPATLWFTGRHSIHWATPARAETLYLILQILPKRIIFK